MEKSAGPALAPVVMVPAAAWRRWLPVALIVVGIGVAAMGDWYHVLSLEMIVHGRDAFQALIAAHWWPALVIYVVAYAAIVALSLPSGGLLTMAGGLCFGWLVGGLAATVAATAGASALFALTRHVASGTHPERWNGAIAKLQSGFRANALSYMLFLRLVPLFPFCIVNIIPSLLGVPFRTFFAGTLFGILPATLAISSVGAGLDEVIAAAKGQQAICLARHGGVDCPLHIPLASLLTPQVQLAVGLLGLLALVPPVLTYWRYRNER